MKANSIAVRDETHGGMVLDLNCESGCKQASAALQGVSRKHPHMCRRSLLLQQTQKVRRIEVTDELTIYVRLLEEGVANVWRPVRAIHMRDDVYRIVSPDDRDDEIWQYSTGMLVHCKEIVFQEGTDGLGAVALAE